MPQVVTEFDDILENDVIFEETENSMEMQDVLKNAENIIKSTMYLKKLVGMSPVFNKLVKVSTLETTAETTITPDAETNLILIKNLIDLPLTLKINGGELVLLPFETFDFPVEGITSITMVGKASIIETKYRLV